MAYGSDRFCLPWHRLLPCHHNRVSNQCNFHFSSCGNSCYGRDLSALYCRQYCDSEISSPQKKILLQNRQFYQHLRHALPYETECGRSGKHLYFKYRRSVDDLHDGLHLLWHEWYYGKPLSIRYGSFHYRYQRRRMSDCHRCFWKSNFR